MHSVCSKADGCTASVELLDDVLYTWVKPRLKSWRGPHVGRMPIPFLLFPRPSPVSRYRSIHVSLPHSYFLPL